MPGWHERTKELQASGALQTVGIIQEQHPDRARLFMQWKEMSWPVLVDPLNLLGVSAVPITLLVDEGGVIRFVRPDEEELATFLRTSYPRRDASRSRPSPPSLSDLAERAVGGEPDALERLGNALLLWGGEDGASRAIDVYEKVLETEPENAPARFRLGVAYRMRYDSSARREGDFAHAVDDWSGALELDPNQYIWRRRIQQYGPRLNKPYSFYDWVREARRDVTARGATPVPLRVEPAGAELAYPVERFETDSSALEEPDPRGRIHRDDGLIDVETTVVPGELAAGASARVHVVLRPNRSRKKAHWNNEVGDLVLWVDPPEGWQVDRRRFVYAVPREPVTQEERRIELEVHAPAEPAERAQLEAYALYYVCEDVDGTCLYRRQDLRIPLAAERKSRE